MSTFVSVITGLTRLESSVNGNPRYLVEFADRASLVTQSDASVSYGLRNPEYHGGTPVIVRTTPADRIWDVQPIDREGSYHVFYVTNLKTRARTQVGVVSGDNVFTMIAGATDPDRLVFREV